MSRVIALLAAVLLTSSVFAFERGNGEIHSWYAGTTYVGSVDTFGFVWRCSGGTCVLRGPYGTGLNMKVCRELSRQVGPLEYYYNDAGMTWSPSENASLLRACNGE